VTNFVFQTFFAEMGKGFLDSNMLHVSTGFPAFPQMYTIDSSVLPLLLASGYVHPVGQMDKGSDFNQAEVVGCELSDQGKQPSSSKGSALHGTGQCRPCAWYWKQGGCQNGAECFHCHMCPEGELKNRKKAKHAAMFHGSMSVSPPESPEIERVDASKHTQDTDSVSEDETTIDPSTGASSEDESTAASIEFEQAVCSPCEPPGLELPGTDAKTDAVTSALHSSLVACLPGDSIKIEKSFAEESRKILILVDVQHGTRAEGYHLMQAIKQNLVDLVACSGVMSLLSARVEREDYGYSLRSSVACIPDNKMDQMCFDVLRKGSCPKRRCCPWYHPQACDIVKFKVAMRCYPKPKSALAIS
jgi:hypothetical protein